MYLHAEIVEGCFCMKMCLDSSLATHLHVDLHNDHSVRGIYTHTQACTVEQHHGNAPRAHPATPVGAHWRAPDLLRHPRSFRRCNPLVTSRSFYLHATVSAAHHDGRRDSETASIATREGTRRRRRQGEYTRKDRFAEQARRRSKPTRHLGRRREDRELCSSRTPQSGGGFCTSLTSLLSTVGLHVVRLICFFQKGSPRWRHKSHPILSYLLGYEGLEFVPPPDMVSVELVKSEDIAQYVWPSSEPRSMIWQAFLVSYHIRGSNGIHSRRT